MVDVVIILSRRGWEISEEASRMSSLTARRMRTSLSSHQVTVPNEDDEEEYDHWALYP